MFFSEIRFLSDRRVVQSSEKPWVFIYFDQKVFKNFVFYMFLRKIIFGGPVSSGGPGPRLQKTFGGLRPESGIQKSPMFPELLQNHCILLCFGGVRSHVVFFGGLRKFKNLRNPDVFLCFACTI